MLPIGLLGTITGPDGTTDATTGLLLPFSMLVMSPSLVLLVGLNP